MYNTNIPQNNNFSNFNSQDTVKYYEYYDGDRVGFLGPFILGGVGGYLLGRPNNFNYVNSPIPVFIPNNTYPYINNGYPYVNNNIYY